MSNARIGHYVIDVGMKFHATEFSEMQVEGSEDRWIIKGLNTDKMELWHNNYVKTSPTERYITKGFHNQKVERDILWQMLNYIETYSWQKHLQHEGVLGDELVAEPEIVAEKCSEKVSMTDEKLNSVGEKWYVKLWKLVKKVFQAS